MGGSGSGRRSSYGSTTHDSLPLDIRKVHRDGLLVPGRRFWWQWTVNGREIAGIRATVGNDNVTLFYQHRPRGADDWVPVEQLVEVTHSACTYGGTRPWWFCPSCNRRVAVLYAAGKLYACRHCYHLPYASQRETASDRAMRRADCIRKRLGWNAGIANPKGFKPKGMHWRTFWRLQYQHDAFSLASFAGLAERLGINRMP